MQQSHLPNELIAALQKIAEEISRLRKALKPEIPAAKNEEQFAEEVKFIQRKIFGDED